MAVLAVFLLPVLLVVGYGSWFSYQGYNNDPVLRGVVERVRHDGMAELALGENIHVTGVESSALSYIWGSGESGSYVLSLAGSKGAGALHVAARNDKGQLTIQSMILDGPHGDRYDLLHHIALPGDGPTNSI